MNRELELVRRVALAADKFYKDSKEFGQEAAVCFTGDVGKSQVRNLESIANSTLKVSDVLDYIKKQVGRENPRKPVWTKDEFGRLLLEKLENDLGKVAEELTKDAAEGARPRERQQVHIQLIQQFVRQTAAQYEFSRKDAAPIR